MKKLFTFLSFAALSYVTVYCQGVTVPYTEPRSKRFSNYWHFNGYG